MSRALDELWAESIKEEKNQPPKANWFELYVKKEKDFQKAIRLVDTKIDFLLQSTADGDGLLHKRLDRLDTKIDFLLFSVFGEVDLENKINQFIEAMAKGANKNG